MKLKSLFIVFVATLYYSVAYAISTSQIIVNNTSWTDLGVGPIMITGIGSAMYAISDTTPVISVGILVPFDRGQPIKTNSHIWGKAVNATPTSILVAPISGGLPPCVAGSYKSIIAVSGQSFTIPIGCTTANVTVIGEGGNGGAGTVSGTPLGGGAGSSGAVAQLATWAVTAQTLYATVGGGGTGVDTCLSTSSGSCVSPIFDAPHGNNASGATGGVQPVAASCPSGCTTWGGSTQRSGTNGAGVGGGGVKLNGAGSLGGAATGSPGGGGGGGGTSSGGTGVGGNAGGGGGPGVNGAGGTAPGGSAAAGTGGGGAGSNGGAGNPTVAGAGAMDIELGTIGPGGGGGGGAGTSGTTGQIGGKGGNGAGGGGGGGGGGAPTGSTAGTGGIGGAGVICVTWGGGSC